MTETQSPYDAAEPAQPALIPEVTAEPPLATLVTRDGRVVRLFLSERAELTIEIEGRGNPLRFDRWQTMALLEMAKELA